MDILVNSTPLRLVCRCRKNPLLLFSTLTLLLLLLSTSTHINATVFHFDSASIEAGIALDGLSMGEIEHNGIRAFFSSATLSDGPSVFNQTATRFGINSLSTSADSSSLIDAAEGISEFLTITFSQSVWLENIVLSLFSVGETAQLSVNRGLLTVLEGMAVSRDSYYFSDFFIPEGESLQLTHLGGNGFSLDSLTIISHEVSESSSMLLMLFVLSLLVFLESHRYRR